MELSTTAVERLSKLADFMDGLKLGFRDKFDMSIFREDRMFCGTVCCAVGWAAHLPEFAALGFRVEETEFTKGIPYFATENGWTAVSKFFDIDLLTVRRLFAADLHEVIKTPQQWAEHCRAYVRENSPAPAPAPEFKQFMAKVQEPVTL